MKRIIALSTVCFITWACSSPPADNSDAGAKDAGSPIDAGTDAGPQDAGPQDAGTDAGPQDAGTDAGPMVDAGPTASVDLFELSGTVVADNISNNVQLLAPFVTVSVDGATTHAYDDRVNGLGCFADHYNLSSNPPPADVNIGTIDISGYSRHDFYLSLTEAPADIVCSVSSGNYACEYSGQSGAAAVQVYGSGTNPMGSNTITFSDSTNDLVSPFSVTGTADGTLTTSTVLNNISYSASNDETIDYSCSPSCGDSDLILVTVAASDNAVGSTSTSSNTFGSLTCAQHASSSITIPKAAIAAMLDNDSNLQSAVTSVIRGQISATTNDSGTIAVIVGRGAFGVESL